MDKLVKKTMTLNLTPEEMAQLQALIDAPRPAPTMFPGITREWFERKVALEGDLEVGAGFSILPDAARSEGLPPPGGGGGELLEQELKRCHEVIGAYVIAQAYADTFPDDAEDAADMKFGRHYWEGAASCWAGEDLLSRAHEAAKARMGVENPVQVRDLDWSAAMNDVVASGGLPREGEDPVCTDCGGSGITYQTERPCACSPTDQIIALLSPSNPGKEG